MHYLITDHAKKRIMERGEYKSEKKGIKAVSHLLNCLISAYKSKKKFEGRKVRMWLTGNAYKVTDGEYKIVYNKYIGEILIISFMKKTKSDKVIGKIILQTKKD